MQTPEPERSELLDYGQLAELMGITRESVRRYTVRDENFPAPAAGSRPRQPRFERSAVDAYLQQRSATAPGKAGRPPRNAPTRRAAAAGGAFGARVRAAIASGKHPVTTQRQLAQLFGISTTNLTRRLNGAASWKRDELQLVHDQLGLAPSRGILVRETPSSSD